jgi:uncharacterized protein YcgI (DUF1989 family)
MQFIIIMQEEKLKVIIAHGAAKKFTLKKSDKFRVESVSGGQVADLVFENFNQTLTRDILRHSLKRRKSIFRAITGTILYDNDIQPRLKLVENRTRSSHDLLFPGCRKELFDGRKKGCLDLLAEALEIPRIRIPAVISLFMDVKGEEIMPSSVKAGEYVVFEALTNVDVAITSCPSELGRWSRQSKSKFLWPHGHPNPNPSEIKVVVNR